MRPLLLCAAAFAALLAAAAGLWLVRISRAGIVLEPEAQRAADPEASPAVLALDIAPAPEPEERVAVDAAPKATAKPSSPEVLVRVVTLEDGAPLAGVRLTTFRLRGDTGEPGGSVPRACGFTDGAGQARLSFPKEGGYLIRCSDREEGDLRVQLQAGEKREATLRLRTRADLDLSLLVLDAQTRAPLAGALIEVQGLEHGGRVPVTGATQAARSGELGLAALRVPSWLQLSADVSREGYGPAFVSLAWDRTDPERPLEVALASCARLEGRVMDRAGGPLGGIVVAAGALESTLSGNPNLVMDLSRAFSSKEKWWKATTQVDGTYALDGLPAGVSLNLEVERGGVRILHEPFGLLLSPGEVRVRDFRLEPGGTIRGVMLDAAGLPLADRRLLLLPGSSPRLLGELEPHQAKTRTDEQGRFSFGGVQPGRWLIGPSAERGSPASGVFSLAQVVELPPGVPAVEVELRLPAGLFVTGRCLDQDGKPVAGVALHAGQGSVRAKSGADGSYSLGPLPAGEVWIGIEEAKGYAMDGQLSMLVVQAGEKDVIVRLHRSATIRGTVVDDATGAGLGAELDLVLESPGYAFGQRSSNSDSAGAFELTEIPAGRYALMARTATGLVSAPRVLFIAPGDAVAVDLRVAPGGRAHVRLPAGQMAKLLVDGAAVELILAGGATTRPFRPGAFAVELFDGSAVREASVEADEVVEIDLR